MNDGAALKITSALQVNTKPWLPANIPYGLLQAVMSFVRDNTAALLKILVLSLTDPLLNIIPLFFFLNVHNVEP